EVVQPGQEIETRVLGVDKENRRISLSIKAVKAPASVEAAAAAGPAPPAKEAKKRKKPLRGGLASHFEW
ncbi:MAG: S1 RNA-binding domain-containing protein, partial [Planctomycetota bacterium]